MSPPDPFELLRRRTRARVALGRAGDGMPTRALLDFQMAHAQARDAVHGQVDFDAIAHALAPLPSRAVHSAAQDRATYLRRPDLGRRLAADVAMARAPCDVALIIADGLSAAAVERHAADLARRLHQGLSDLVLSPVILAAQARVALGDEIGERLGARLVIMLIGERPGLSSADSLGAYLTFAPVIGTRDSARNCVSNIHAHGLLPDPAADKILWLARQALSLNMTGIGLKEDAPETALPHMARPLLGD